MSRYQKGKTNLDFTGAREVSGSGISWAICKSATRSRQITMPALHYKYFCTVDLISLGAFLMSSDLPDYEMLIRPLILGFSTRCLVENVCIL